MRDINPKQNTTSEDVVVVKLDAQLRREWAYSYSSDLTSKNKVERGYYILQVNDGFIVSGLRQINTTTDPTLLLMKLNPEGKVRWAKAYGDFIGDRFTLTEDGTGDFVVGASGTTGTIQTPCNGTLAFLRVTDEGNLSTDATGNTRSFCEWYPGTVWKEQWTIRTKDGAYVLAVWQQDYNPANPNLPPYDVLVVKFAANGTFLWGKAFNNTNTIQSASYHDDTADFISETSDGGFAVAGVTMVGSEPSQGNYKALMLRLV